MGIYDALKACRHRRLRTLGKSGGVEPNGAVVDARQSAEGLEGVLDLQAE